MTSIEVNRVYDPPEEGPNYRILVDRLWPRDRNYKRTDIKTTNHNIKDCIYSPQRIG